MPYSQFSHLADSAGHRILVTTHAGLRVIQRTQTVIDAVLLFKRLLVLREGVSRRFGKAIADTLGSRVCVQCWSTESGEGLRASLAQYVCNGAQEAHHSECGENPEIASEMVSHQ